MVSTVGAALKWVIPSVRSSRQISAGSTERRQTWVPPAAVTAQVKHHPLQWNIGSVHRYLVPGPRRAWYAIAVALQVRTPVVVHHALGPPGRPAGVVDFPVGE